MTADRNLFLGILALQLDFISRDQMVTAMNTWVLDKHRPLGAILIDQQAIRPEQRTLLDAIVDEHIKHHNDDPEQSLRALSSLGSAQSEIAQQLDDSDLAATFALVGANRQDPADADATYSFVAARAAVAGPRFHILRAHARGGLGQVAVALDNELNREVALKEIQERYADDPSSRGRFVLEAEITGGLEHPGIVPVYSLGQYADGRPFYAMRFIRGDSLKEIIERYHDPQTKDAQDAGTRRLELRKLLGRLIDVCNAIEYAHSRGVLHRDLKPGNIMLGKYGETLVVDWGLAKAQGRSEEKCAASDEATLQPVSTSGSAVTQLGSAIGTPAYMSPEQAAGKLDQLGPASDVYSLGATLYHLLTGRTAFVPDQAGDILRKVEQGMFPPPRQVERSVPAPLEAICLKAMAIRPQDRYATPRQMADDLEHWLADEPVAAHRESFGQRVSRWARRHRSYVRAAAVALLLITGISVVATIGINQAREQEARQRQRANHNAQQAIQAAAAAKQSEKRARDAEAVARKEQQRALAEAQTARATTSFVLRTLEGADPFVQFGRGSLEGHNLTVVDLLDRGSQQIEALNDRPLVQAEILRVIGNAYRGLGRLEQSTQALERSVAIYTAQRGAAAPETAVTQGALGQSLLELHDYPRAEAILRPAWETLRAIRVEDDPEVAKLEARLAACLVGLGREQEAKEHFDRAIENLLATIAVENPGMAELLRSGATWATSKLQGRQFDLEYLPFGHQAIIMLIELAEQHDISHLLTELSQTILLGGNASPDEAVAAVDRTRELLEEMVGRKHILVALLRFQAIYLQARGGHPELAIQSAPELISLLQSLFGPDHPYVSWALWQLALLQDDTDHQAALATSQEALRIATKSAATTYPKRIAIGEAFHARRLAAVGRIDEAIDLARHALHGYEQAGGQDQDWIALVKSELAKNLALHKQDYQGAESLYREALTLMHASSDTFRSSFIVMEIAALPQVVADPAAVEAIFAAELKHLEKHASPVEWSSFVTTVANWYASRGNYPATLKILRPAAARVRSAPLMHVEMLGLWTMIALAQEEVEEYREGCNILLKIVGPRSASRRAAGEFNNIVFAASIIRICTLHPDAVSDTQLLVRVARESVELAPRDFAKMLAAQRRAAEMEQSDTDRQEEDRSQNQFLGELKYVLGTALFRNDEYDAALQNLDEATQLSSNEGGWPLWLFQGMALQRLGRSAEAAPIFCIARHLAAKVSKVANDRDVPSVVSSPIPLAENSGELWERVEFQILFEEAEAMLPNALSHFPALR